MSCGCGFQNSLRRTSLHRSRRFLIDRTFLSARTSTPVGVSSWRFPPLCSVKNRSAKRNVQALGFLAEAQNEAVVRGPDRADIFHCPLLSPCRRLVFTAFPHFIRSRIAQQSQIFGQPGFLTATRNEALGYARVEGGADEVEVVEVGGSAVVVARGEFRV